MHVDEEGYTRVLGRTVAIDRAEYTLDLYTPLPSFGAVDTVRCGEMDDDAASSRRPAPLRQSHQSSSR